jgi:aryl-alcohol dehydrogenase-like predicted oxidoreductase
VHGLGELPAGDVPAAQDAGLGLLPWSPLGGGWLSGKYTRDQQPTGTTRLGENPSRGMEAWDRRSGDERTWSVVSAVQKVAEGRDVPMAQVALAWLAARPAVTSVILGARTLEQLDANLAAADLVLTADETAALDEASVLPVGDYPYGELGLDQRSRRLQGAG